MRRTSLLAVLSGLASSAALLAFSPGPAWAATAGSPPAAAPARERVLCPPSKQPGVMSCQSVLRIPGRAEQASGRAAGTAGGQPLLGYSPASLRGAYRLGFAAQHDGRGATVAIVDAYSNPEIATSLAAYRRHFGLPPCSVSDHCLRIVNQEGQPSPLPSASVGWSIEEATDVDMVSAICPYCHILLVESMNATIGNLGAAEDVAAASGARFISDSWSAPEFAGEIANDKYFNHPGDAITVAAGDYGYAAWYPAASQFVTAVGGTTLTRDKHSVRGWTERAWGVGASGSRFGTGYASGTGSGCSIFEAKPAWQRSPVDDSPSGCLNRTVADVSAVADPITGVAIYDSYGTIGLGGPWLEIGGTSVATPIIAATYALAGQPAARTYPSSYPYRRASALFDVTRGVDGLCERTRLYLCQAKPGYDGPTGLGTPDGTSAFTSHGVAAVTLADPGPQDLAAGSPIRLRISGLDTRAAAVLSYRAGGMPAGLSIRSVAGSTDAIISGSLPARPVDRLVTVTARDDLTGQSGSVRFRIVGVTSLTAAAPTAPGRIGMHDGLLCLASETSPGSTGVVIQDCGATAGQEWTYASDGAPGGGGTISAGSSCVTKTGSQVVVAVCAPADAAQEWIQAGYGLLRNAAGGGCLAVGKLAAGQPVRIIGCVPHAEMRWTLPGGLLVSGTSGLCAESTGGNAVEVPVTVATCGPAVGPQRIGVHSDGSLESLGFCLDVPGPELAGATYDGATVMRDFCLEEGEPSQVWMIGPGGELVNYYSGRCLTEPAGGGSGTTLVQEDCYGSPGQIWAVN